MEFPAPREKEKGGKMSANSFYDSSEATQMLPVPPSLPFLLPGLRRGTCCSAMTHKTFFFIKKKIKGVSFIVVHVSKKKTLVATTAENHVFPPNSSVVNVGN